MKKESILKFALFIMTGLMLVTSCSDSDSDDNKSATSEQTTKEELKSALVGIHPDASESLMGSDDVMVWNLKEDGTFELLCVSPSDQEVDGSIGQEVLTGTWEPLVNIENPYSDSGETLQGFRASFDYGDDEDFSDDDKSTDYYTELVVDEEGDTVLLILSETAFGFFSMAEADDDTRTRILDPSDFERVREQTTTNPFKIMYNNIKKVVSVVKSTTEIASRYFVKAVGLDVFSNLTVKQCADFYNEASKAIKEMQNGQTTNYSEWMTEIYTKKGKDPRICDMNIPGTHDAFTSYFQSITKKSLIGAIVSPLIPVATYEVGRYCIAQLKDIAGQWEVGVRYFDTRIGTTTAGNDKVVGLYHGDIFLGCMFEEGIQYIVDQLDKHPGETAIASISFEDKHGDVEHKLVYDIIQKFVAKGKIVTNPQPDMKLSDCKGKLIVMQDWDNGNSKPEYRIGPAVSAGKGRYEAGTIKFYNNTPPTEVKYEYQNLYEMESAGQLVAEFWKSKRTQMEACFQAAAKTKGQSAPVWALNQVNAYVGFKNLMSYSKNSNVMHPWTANYIFQHKKDKMGIIQMDFAGTNDSFDGYITNGEALPRVVVETNRYQ